MSYKPTSAWPILAVLFAAAAPRSQAQATPAANTNGDNSDETVVLSPFVIDASEDANGYQATSTTAGTRIRTDLKDVASSISVVTKQFLDDTSTHNAQDLLTYTPNTEVGGLNGNFSGQAQNVTYQENLVNPNNNTRVRGLDTADNTRDNFLTDIPFDTFNVDRIDLQRGPNSILFGVGSPAGIINASLNGATYKTAYNVKNVTGSYGTERNSIDFNQVLSPNVLAIRVAAVVDDERYQQKPAFNDSQRYYAAFRFDPKLFGDSNHTSLTANYEYGRVNADNPRTIPPDDQITRYFANGATAVNNTLGLNKVTIDEYNPGFGAGSNLAKADFPNFAIGRVYWPTPLLYYNNTSSLPVAAYEGEIGTGWAINSNGQIAPPNSPGGNTNIGIGGLPDYQPMAIAPYSHYANAQLPGGSYYANKVLTDPSIFDFYNKILDGNNSREWQHWYAANVALAQTFFNDRVGFELAYNSQSYLQGQSIALTGETYGINVDVNAVLPDGSANPNLGRPFVAGGGDSGSQSSKVDRNSSRATAFGEFRPTDFWSRDSWITKIVGLQRLTGLLELDHKKQTDISWSSYALDPSWETLNNFNLTTKSVNYDLFTWMDYIGPSLLGASSAANANLSNININIAPPTNATVTWYNSHWKYSLNPTDPSYVNPAAPYTYNDSNSGSLTTSTQSNNPANYVGWQSAQVHYLSATNPQDFPSLVTGGDRTRFRDFSKALVWQGHYLDDDLVTTYGWRKDSIVNYDTGAPIDPNTSLAALNYADDATSRQTVSGQTRTWGGVYRLPKTLTKYLPWGTTIGVLYNHAQNFKADAPRVNMAGEQIPNPDGITKEYGLTVSTLNDKITFRAVHYQTTVHWATLNSNSLAGLGGLGYYFDLIPAWGYGYAALLQAGLDGKFGPATTNNNQWDYILTDYQHSLNGAPVDNSVVAQIGDPAYVATHPVATYGYQGSGTVTETDIVNAWLHMPIPDSFFNYYGITGNRPVPALAHSTGKLYLGFTSPAPDGNLSGVGGQQPSGTQSPVSTVDNVSTGWEYELVGQPTKNWNVSINFSKTDATKNNIDPITQKFMADNLKFYEGPGGQLRLWGASQTAGNSTSSAPGVYPEVYPYTQGQANGSTVGPDWIQGVYNPYLVTATAQGQSAPEVSPWRLNVVTTYNFDRGMLNGFRVGGGWRVEAGRILGYRYNTTTGILDVNQTLYGPNDNHVDAWIGYTRKINLSGSHPIKWNIQLNLRNVGEKAHLVAARYEPDGTLALARIEDGMTWQLTNGFDF